MVERTLDLIDLWYRDSDGDDKPQLLSKLALLELSGWLEEWMDELVRSAGNHLGEEWVNTLLKSTNTFDFERFRKNLVTLLGEYNLRRIEREFEEKHPGELDYIKTKLANLKKERDKLAHMDLITHLDRYQKTIEAPSSTRRTYRELHERLSNFKDFILADQACMPRGI
jgi:hypothetical protein